MPPVQDERTLMTLFADVHYFISPASQRPPHHRFEKASYFYLYQSTTSSAARIEIANNPGTAYQDAFTGALSAAAVTYSHKQPGLVNFTVTTRSQAPDAQGLRGESSQAALWQLKDFNEQRGVEYLYLLNSLDVYFWTERDAGRFIDALQSLGQGGAGALDIRDRPAPVQQAQAGQRHSGSPRTRVESVNMSPVVQKLEQAAITPAYGHASQQRDSVSTVASVAQPTHTATPPLSVALPPPPPPPPTGVPHSASPPTMTPQFSPPPLAYNPAAPAAPEPITHREKTPPPPEDGTGTGLKTAAAATDPPAAPYSPYGSAGRPAQFSPPPPPAHTGTGGLYSTPTPPAPGPPRPAGLPFQQYAGAGAGSGTGAPPLSPPPPTSPPAYMQNFAGPPAQPQQQQQQQGSPSPHAQYGGYSPAAPQVQAQQGYFGQQPGGVPDASAIHSTAYRPTEAEMAAHGKTAGQGQGAGKSGRFDRGVDRFLKKLDKSWG